MYITFTPVRVTRSSIPHSTVQGRNTETSSGSRGQVKGGPRNMKSMQPPSAAIFFMTYFYRTGAPWPPRAPPPGSATGNTLQHSRKYGRTTSTVLQDKGTPTHRVKDM